MQINIAEHDRGAKIFPASKDHTGVGTLFGRISPSPSFSPSSQDRCEPFLGPQADGRDRTRFARDFGEIEEFSLAKPNPTFALSLKVPHVAAITVR